jgi:hypothetical protein
MATNVAKRRGAASHYGAILMRHPWQQIGNNVGNTTPTQLQYTTDRGEAFSP